MNLSIFIADNLMISLSFETSTESKEVLYCLRANITEQFKDNLLTISRVIKVHYCILSRFRIVDCLTISVLCNFTISTKPIFIEMRIFV
jgi:hypothetical protein